MPANRLFLTMAWMPQLPSTTWVTPKSTPTEISEIASSSVNPFGVHQETARHLAERIAQRKMDRGLFVDILLRRRSKLLQIVGEAEPVENPFVLSFEQRVVEGGE